MRSVIIIALLVVFAQAVQETSSSQGTLFSEELSRDLMQSKLGRAILRMATLKTRTQQVDFGRLFGAVDDLVDSLKERKTDENTLFESDYQQYLSDYGFYQVQVTEYTEEAAGHQVAVDELVNARGDSQSLLQQKSRELAAAKADRQDVLNNQNGNARSVEAALKNYDGALAVIDQATAQIQQIYDGPKRGTKFIEVTPEDINGMGVLLQKHVQHIAAEYFYQPMVDILTQMTQQHFSDQKNVRSVLDLLGKFRAELATSRNAIQASFDNETAANQQIVATYDEKIDTLSNQIIPGLQEDIEVKNGQIQTKSELLKDATDNLNAAQENYDITESNWTNRQAQHKTLIEGYDRELQLLASAVVALERGGIRRE